MLWAAVVWQYKILIKAQQSWWKIFMGEDTHIILKLIWNGFALFMFDIHAVISTILSQRGISGRWQEQVIMLMQLHRTGQRTDILAVGPGVFQTETVDSVVFFLVFFKEQRNQNKMFPVVHFLRICTWRHKPQSSPFGLVTLCQWKNAPAVWHPKITAWTF